MTAEDVGAALAAFALSFTAALRATDGGSANDALEALANELKDMAGHMNAPDGTPTAARAAIDIAADMLEASAPNGE